MPTPHGLGATRKLTRIGLVVSPRRGLGRWLARATLALAGLLTGVAASQFYEARQNGLEQQQAAAARDRQQLQEQLDQGKLTSRVADAHRLELERQIAALSQQLRESQEELAFFRKARDGRR